MYSIVPIFTACYQSLCNDGKATCRLRGHQYNHHDFMETSRNDPSIVRALVSATSRGPWAVPPLKYRAGHPLGTYSYPAESSELCLSTLPRAVDIAMPPDNTDSHQTPKRRKVAESCRPCRAKKTRCDGAHPICSSCSAKNLRCEYNAATVPVSNDILEGIESRLRKLEQQVSSTKAHIKERDHSGKP